MSFAVVELADPENSLYDVCPSVDPQILLQTLPGIDSLLGSYSPQFSDCGSTLQGLNCVKDLNYPDLSGFSLSYLSALPSTTGTGSYSDLSGQLSTPPAAVIVETIASGVAVSITAANAGAGDSEAGAMTTTPTGGGGSSPNMQASSSGAAANGGTTAAPSGGPAAGEAASSSPATPSSTSAATSMKADTMTRVIGLLLVLVTSW